MTMTTAIPFDQNEDIKKIENEQIQSLKDINEKEKHEKKMGLSHGETALQKVIEDGDTHFLYELGPFEKDVLKDIVKKAKDTQIPICVLERTKANKNELSKDQLKKQNDLVQSLQSVYAEISKTAGEKHKKNKNVYQSLNDKKQKISEKLSMLMQKQKSYIFYLYINASRIDFISEIIEKRTPNEDVLKDTHLSMNTLPLSSEQMMCCVDTDFTLEQLNQPKNYGALATFYMEGKDYFEVQIKPEFYKAFRDHKTSPCDHIAIKYEGYQNIRMIFETNRLIDYVFYLCRAKKENEDLFIQYVHADQNEYHNLDYTDLPDKKNKDILDWEMPLSFKKLKEILDICEKENQPVSYRIYLPKVDLAKKENFKDIKVIFRTQLDLQAML